jgi:hypothetical protein
MTQQRDKSLLELAESHPDLTVEDPAESLRTATVRQTPQYGLSLCWRRAVANFGLVACASQGGLRERPCQINQGAGHIGYRDPSAFRAVLGTARPSSADRDSRDPSLGGCDHRGRRWVPFDESP